MPDRPKASTERSRSRARSRSSTRNRQTRFCSKPSRRPSRSNGRSGRTRPWSEIAVAAGQSDQYDRATEIAAGIENAEARARALVLVAESQARQNQNDAATQSYNLVGQAVSSIQQNGLRGVLTGILIDSLISTGRFEDARASLALYPSDSERFVAMGAIAESQGARRMATQARTWIDNDVPAEYRSTLYRRLSNGVLRSISEDRAREFQGRDLDENR